MSKRKVNYTSPCETSGKTIKCFGKQKFEILIKLILIKLIKLSYYQSLLFTACLVAFKYLRAFVYLI